MLTSTWDSTVSIPRVVNWILIYNDPAMADFEPRPVFARRRPRAIHADQNPGEYSGRFALLVRFSSRRSKMCRARGRYRATNRRRAQSSRDTARKLTNGKCGRTMAAHSREFWAWHRWLLTGRFRRSTCGSATAFPGARQRPTRNGKSVDVDLCETGRDEVLRRVSRASPWDDSRRHRSGLERGSFEVSTQKRQFHVSSQGVVQRSLAGRD